MKRSDQFQKRGHAARNVPQPKLKENDTLFIRAVLQVTDFFQKSLGFCKLLLGALSRQ